MRINSGKDVTIVSRWIRKCESEIKEENNITIPDLTTNNTPPQSEIQNNSLPQSEISSQQQQKQQDNISLSTPKQLPDIKYQYYQSATSINISVLVKNLTPDDVSVDFQPSHLRIHVRIDGVEGIHSFIHQFINSLIYSFTHLLIHFFYLVNVFDKKLYSTIIPSECTISVRKPKVLIIILFF